MVAVTGRPNPGQAKSLRWEPERRVRHQDGGTQHRRASEESSSSSLRGRVGRQDGGTHNRRASGESSGPTRRGSSTITFSEREFDVNTLPDDMRRVYLHLEEKFGGEYGLLFIFTIRTAVELHRAWNMSLLTNAILQQIKDEFNLRMNWDLGVLSLVFTVEEGTYELRRRVPYDFDSEFQDIYHRIAVALVNGQINVHEALVYQCEAKQGKHTAKSGLFIRNFPGRLLLYPCQAATCAVIFFQGGWIDAGVAAICGLTAGLVDYGLSCVGGQATVLLDVLVGISTGVIGGLVFRWSKAGEDCMADPETAAAACAAAPCLSAVYLGTLYWFFYGAAFVIGILEIIAGELATGVTRFVGVTLKTFVLSLGASVGLLLAFAGQQAWAANAWYASSSSCNGSFVEGAWWRLLVYLGNCIFVLGQCRLPIAHYWRALIVQLVAYEVQYQVFNGMGQFHVKDHMDTAASNMIGAAFGVCAASLVSWIVNVSGAFFQARILQDNVSENTKLGDFYFQFLRTSQKAVYHCGLGRPSDIMKFEVEDKLRVLRRDLQDPHLRISGDEDVDVIIDAIIGTQDINTWSILMPAVYQLVPGSIIAKLWFGAIFFENPYSNEGDDNQASQASVFANLMVISTSIALGLIIGFCLFQSVISIFIAGRSCFMRGDEESQELGRTRNKYLIRRHSVMEGMFTVAPDANDDPDSFGDKFKLVRTYSRRNLMEGIDIDSDDDSDSSSTGAIAREEGNTGGFDGNAGGIGSSEGTDVTIDVPTSASITSITTLET